MTDQELLNAIELIVAPIKGDLISVKEDVNGIKVILDADIRRDISLLSEGHEIILERLPNPAELEAIDARLSAVETVVRKHSNEIQDLKKAQ